MFVFRSDANLSARVLYKRWPDNLGPERLLKVFFISGKNAYSMA